MKSELEIIEIETLLQSISKQGENLKHIDDNKKTIIKTKLYSINNWLENFDNISNIFEYFVDEKGFSKSDFDEIDIILRSLHSHEIQKINLYIKNPLDITHFTSITEPVNIADYMLSLTGMNHKFIKHLFVKEGKTKSGKGVGRGELFLGFMINDAKNAIKGDINVNGDEYEVKAREARLLSQNGFNMGKTAIISFLKYIETEHSDIFKAVGFSKINSKETIQSFTLNQNTTNNSFQLFFVEWIKSGKNISEAIELVINHIFTGSFGIWPTANDQVKKILSDSFINNINKLGIIIDINDLLYSILYANIIYYQMLDGFKGMFLINNKTYRISYFDPQIQDKNWLKKYTTVRRNDWWDNPTSNCFKITLK